MENPTQFVIDEVLRISEAPYPLKEFDYLSDGMIVLFTSNLDFLIQLDKKRIWQETGLYCSTSHVGDPKTSRWGRFLSVWIKDEKGNYTGKHTTYRSSPEWIETVEGLER